MKHFLKSIFRPVGNREYGGKKRSLLVYATEYIPFFMISIFAGISASPWFFLLLGLVVLIGMLQYIFFDNLYDKLWWKIVWKRFYKDEVHEVSETDALMQNVEQNPTPENIAKLRSHIEK